jgi:hypothetical protein
MPVRTKPAAFMLKGQGLLARSLFVLFLRLADRHAAIDGQGFQNHVKPLAVLVLKNDALSFLPSFSYSRTL